MKRSFALAFILGLTWGLDTYGLRATELLRGPYLQVPTADGVTIRWRTDVATPSMVTYTAPGTDLSWFTVDQALTTEHSLRLSGLTPGTLYHYTVGTFTETLAQGVDCQFLTTPVPGHPAGPTRVWVIGDSGGFALGSQSVLPMRDAYRSHTGDRHTDVWLTLGDNAYNSGTDEEYQADFFNVFSSMLRQAAPWTTIGNHEAYSANGDGWFPYLDMFSFLTKGEAGGVASGSPRYYSFDYGDIHFICLDAMTQSRAADGEMANWLRTDLENSSSQWKIAFWHHPPYSKGGHDSDWEIEQIEMRQNIVPILEARGVDLVLCGHSHCYERSYLLRGHYGISTTLQPSMILDQGSGRASDTGPYIKPVSGPLANQGTVYVVAGNAASTEAGSGRHPAMFAEDLRVGSVLLDINTNRLDASFLRSSGLIADTFTIIKGEPEPLRICSFFLQGSNAVVRWKSLAGQPYRVERADDLQASNWQPVSDPIIASGATTSWTNAIDGLATVGFFRVSQLEQGSRAGTKPGGPGPRKASRPKS